MKWTPREWRGCSHPVWRRMPNWDFRICCLCGLSIERRGLLWWRRVFEIRDDAGKVLWREE